MLKKYGSPNDVITITKNLNEDGLTFARCKEHQVENCLIVITGVLFIIAYVIIKKQLSVI